MTPLHSPSRPDAIDPPPSHARLLLALFFLSGAAALGYQILWSKYLLDFMGVSAYSYAAVLASFMAGLAAGSAVFGRVADRVASPLRLLAGLELAVAAYSLLYPFTSRLAAALYETLVRASAGEDGTGSGLWAKALVAGLLLVPATFLMGGTFPAVLRHVARTPESLGRRSAHLYAANAAASVAGALGMAFLSLPLLGMRRSLLLLGGLNVAVGVAAAVLARRAPAPPPSPAPQPSGPETAGRRARLALLAAAGFVSFAAEIAWTRCFSVVLGSSTYSFAVIVAAFVAAIAVGSAWVGRRAASITHPFALFGWTQLLAAVAIIASVPLYPYLPWLLRGYASLLAPVAPAFAAYEAGSLLLCFAALLPPALFMGMSLPLVLMDRAGSLEGVGREAGRAYAWNTWGNVAGALVAGHLLLPRLGMEGLLRASALLAALVGFAAVWLDLPAAAAAAARRRAVALSVLGIAVVAGVHLTARRWDPAWFTLFPARNVHALSYAEADERVGQFHTVFAHDDPAANIVVYRTVKSSGHDYLLCVNGKPDASAVGDMPTQLLLGHVPMLLAPDPRRVLVIGLASGVTAGAVLKHPVEALDVVELVRAMPQATRFFDPWNGDPLGDPRTRLIIDDARSHLTYTGQAYDVVISEPSNPWMAGVGGLFSADFYARARRAMAPGGVYVQWLQLYELGDETFAAAVRTFRRSFPYVHAFQGNGVDLLMMGSERPLRLDVAALDARFGHPPVRDQLRTIGVTEPGVLLGLQRLSPATVDFIAAMSDRENDDENRLLEYQAPRDMFARRGVTLVNMMDERLHASPALLWHEYVRQRPAPRRAVDMVRLLEDKRLQFAPLYEAYQLAAFHLDPPALLDARREERALFSAGLWLDHPPSAEVLAAEIERGLDRPLRLEAPLKVYSPAILLESALSPDKADLWRSAAARWHDRAPRAWLLRALEVDLLMAGGRGEEAAVRLRAWLDEREPPALQWGVLRACQLDAGALCDHALRRYAGAARRSIVNGLRDLRAAVPRP